MRKAQSVIISSYLAAVLVVVVIIAMYAMLYPWMTNYTMNYRNINVLKVVREKVYWEPKELAMKISGDLGADYVYVHIKAVYIVNMSVLFEKSYKIVPYDVDLNKLMLYSYQFSRTIRNGTMYIYYIEVGYK